MATPPPPAARHDALPPVRALCAVVRRLSTAIAPLPHVLRLISELAISWTIDRACAFPGSLPLLERLRDRERARLRDSDRRRLALTRALAAAAGRGDLVVVEWLHRNFSPGVDCVGDAVRAAVVGGHSDVIQWLESAHDNRVPLGIPEMELAAGSGSADVLSMILARLEPVGRSWRRPERVNDAFRCLCAAARAGHLDIVKSLSGYVRLLERNRGSTERQELVVPVKRLAASGHLDVLRWFHSTRRINAFSMPWAGALRAAAKNGHSAMVDWLLELGVCPDEAGAIDEAVESGRLA